jgi:hypothetical protein
MDKRETTEKYKYSPAWMDRVKRAEGGGMPDGDGDMDYMMPSPSAKARMESDITDQMMHHDYKDSSDDDSNLARGRMSKLRTDNIED